ncbi:MAG TPA: DUF4364 family protein [Clostridiaceae bacterium]|nr:DUF4364 family protein [Clostridiaceae bacterium]
MALDQTTLNKVIILKLVSLLPGLRHTMLSDAVLDSLQMNFFEYSLALSELIEGKLLYKAVRKGEPHLDADQQAVERIDITQKGTEVLQALENQIPDAVNKWINRKSAELKGEQNILETHSSRLEQTGTGEWMLILERYETDVPNFTIRLNFPTREMAKKAASAWEAASVDLYELILKRLLAN